MGGEAPAPPQPGEAAGAAARQQGIVVAAGPRVPLGVRDVKLWYIPFESLEMQKQIGEGSFGRWVALRVRVGGGGTALWLPVCPGCMCSLAAWQASPVPSHAA